MKKIKILLVVCFILISNIVTAQKLGGTDYKQIAKNDADSMRLHLKLSSFQTEQVTVILEKFLLALSSRPASDSTPYARRIRLGNADYTKGKELKKVLNSTQWKLYEKHMEMMRKKSAANMEEKRKKNMEKPKTKG